MDGAIQRGRNEHSDVQNAIRANAIAPHKDLLLPVTGNYFRNDTRVQLHARRIAPRGKYQ